MGKRLVSVLMGLAVVIGLAVAVYQAWDTIVGWVSAPSLNVVWHLLGSLKLLKFLLVGVFAAGAAIAAWRRPKNREAVPQADGVTGDEDQTGGAFAWLANDPAGSGESDNPGATLPSAPMGAALPSAPMGAALPSAPMGAQVPSAPPVGPAATETASP